MTTTTFSRFIAPFTRTTALVVGLTTVCGVTASPVLGQPLWKVVQSISGNGLIEVPHHVSLNPTNGFTFEAWLQILENADEVEGCRGIASKNYQQAWLVGICSVGGKWQLRSFLKGSGSARTAGVITGGPFNHVAVTFDGTTRRHYVDGELVGQWAETAPLGTSTAPLRLMRDASGLYPAFDGRLDEVRLWNVGRTQTQLRSTITQAITSAQPGLVAVYSFEDGTAADVIGPRDGTPSGPVSFLTFGPFECDNSFGDPNVVCLNGERFAVTAHFRQSFTALDATSSQQFAQVVPGAADASGLLWFFAEDNWEIMVKILDGCPLNEHYWVFSAATTDLHYHLTVRDETTGRTQTYINFAGAPAPAVTDTNAFASCP